MTTNDSQEREHVDALSTWTSFSHQDLSSGFRDYLRKIIRARMDHRLSARMDESDLIQETLTEAVRRIDHQSAKSNLPVRLWLRQIALDRILMAQRRHLHSQKRSVLREAESPNQSSILWTQRLLQIRGAAERPIDELAHQELLKSVRMAIEKLSAIDQEILTMRTFEELSYDEIELLLDIPAATSRKRFARSLVKLNRLIGADLHPDHPDHP